VTLGLSVTEKFGISWISLIASNSAAILNVLLKITPCLSLVDDARGLSRLSSSKSKDDNLGFGIFEKVDQDLGLGRGTAWDARGCKDYCYFVFGDV